jgi:primosomal protein N' (replication factor Y)
VIARIEPLTTTRKLAGPFDYLQPDPPLEVGEVVRIPFGHQRLDGVVVELAATSEVPEEKLVAPLSRKPESIPAELVDLAMWMAGEYCSTPARALQLVLPPRGKAKTELWAEPAGAEPEKPLTEKQSAALAALPGPAKAALATLRSLERKGFVRIRPRVQRRVPRADPGPDRVVKLLPEQEAAVTAIARGGSHLLHGVTGSGKTEVYLRAAQAALEAGRGAIVLVPEIALTPQTVGRFQARFGDTVALLHSSLSEGERFDEWVRLRRGEARIAVGPRSAVFAPVADLGLIVVDEEHDPSYKHEGDPRYDARLVARWRAAYTGATLVAGTATPRPETWRELPRLSLPRRVDGQSLPPVQILDMKGAHHPLHPETRQALADVAAAGRKAIVLLNRRGWSNFLTCRSCGKVWECPNCDVALVLHRAAGQIACHHCGHRAAIPQRCDKCGSTSVARHGAGTERLEAELADGLDVPVFRLDADTTGTKDAVPRLLAEFRAAPSGLLVGTQLVAKGHDFPDVTLGVVVDADATLRFPDFRAEERTFALVAQLAGRAGRGEQGGRVMVQTVSPDAPSLQHAARHDAEGFLAGELDRREMLGYPPFADLIRVVCTSAAPYPAMEAVESIAAAVRPRAPAVDRFAAARAAEPLPPTQLLGPAPLFRLRGRDRFQLVVKTTERAAAVAAVGAAVEAAAVRKEFRDVTFSVDVDPQ